MTTRAAQSNGYALYAVMTTLGTWYCAYEAKQARPFRCAVGILASATALTLSTVVLTLKQSSSTWRWKDVRILSTATAVLTHLFILVLYLSVEQLKSPFIALGSSIAAGALAYQLCNLKKSLLPPRPRIGMGIAAPVPTYITETLPGIVVPPYRVALCKCLHGAMSQARKELGELKENQQWRFSDEELLQASGDVLGITIMLGIYHLFKNSYAHEKTGTLIFNGMYQNQPVAIEIDKEKGSWFNFNLPEFQTSLFSLRPNETELLVHHLVQANPDVIAVANQQVSTAGQQKIQTLLTHIREARTVFERHFMQLPDDFKDKVQFSSIFLEKIDRPAS